MNDNSPMVMDWKFFFVTLVFVGTVALFGVILFILWCGFLLCYLIIRKYNNKRKGCGDIG